MLVSLYKQPHMQASVMAEWTQVRQGAEEDLRSFMFRVQEMGEKAFIGFPDSHRQQLAVFAFCRGMIDTRAAQLVMLHAKNKVHKALSTATSLVGKTDVPLTIVPEPVPATTRATRAKYQAYAAVEKEDPNDDYRRDEEEDAYNKALDFGEEGDYEDYFDE